MNTKQLSVVVGRFQVQAFHAGHRYLLDAASASGDLLVVLGSSAGLPDLRNPLPCAVRQVMLAAAYPQSTIVELYDHPSDVVWSERLDAMITAHAGNRTPVLYASRDSFASVYTGRYPIMTLPQLAGHNGTAMREAVEHLDSPEYRAGLIAAQRHRLPISYQSVDVGVLRYAQEDILLGQKDEDGDRYRLIGGFVDPRDPSLEAAASREMREECGDLSHHGLRYLGSYRIDDHRYRGSTDGLMTALFATYHLAGMPRAGDDIARVAWIPLHEAVELVVPNHRPLVERIVKFHHKQ